MEVRIHGRNLELDDKTRDYIAGKLNRLGRHLPGITTAAVKLAKENTKAQDQRVVAQATLDIDGTVLRGEEREANAISAVDSVIGVMDRRVERYKGKVCRSKQAKKANKNAPLGTVDLPTESTDEGSTDDEIVEAQGRVVRLKRFPIKAMTVDEVAFQMELLGHDFFMFLDRETEQYGLLYKRHDGDYGLIKPEPL